MVVRLHYLTGIELQNPRVRPRKIVGEQKSDSRSSLFLKESSRITEKLADKSFEMSRWYFYILFSSFFLRTFDYFGKTTFRKNFKIKIWKLIEDKLGSSLTDTLVYLWTFTQKYLNAGQYSKFPNGQGYFLDPVLSGNFLYKIMEYDS